MEVIQLHNSIIVTVLAIYNMNSEGNSVVVSLILTEHYQFNYYVTNCTCSADQDIVSEKPLKEHR